MLDPLEGLPVFQIWRDCIGHGLEIPIWQQKKRDGNTIFQVRYIKTLVLKNHFVREVGCFPRADHIITYNLRMWRITSSIALISMGLTSFAQ